MVGQAACNTSRIRGPESLPAIGPIVAPWNAGMNSTLNTESVHPIFEHLSESWMVNADTLVRDGHVHLAGVEQR